MRSAHRLRDGEKIVEALEVAIEIAEVEEES